MASYKNLALGIGALCLLQSAQSSASQKIRALDAKIRRLEYELIQHNIMSQTKEAFKKINKSNLPPQDKQILLCTAGALARGAIFENLYNAQHQNTGTSKRQ